VLPNASLIAIDDYDTIWASGYGNTGYLDENGVWQRIPELADMQANAHAFWDDRKVAFNAVRITRDSANLDHIEYRGLFEFTSSDVTHAEENPTPFALESASYPNPFNAATTIRFTLPGPGRVTVGIYSITGQLVCTLADRAFPAGENALRWDSRTDTGETVGSGLYFYRITAGKNIATGKMLLLK
jgi:hypothetical protein